MKRIAFAAATAAALIGAPAMAQQNGSAAANMKQEYKLGSLIIRQPWTRATPRGAPVAGGYVTVTNTGKTPDRLTGGTFTGAGMVQVHEMTVTNGVMKMRHLEKGLEIKPGATVTLKPGGAHLMFMKLTSGVALGKPVEGSLNFEKAGKIKVIFAVGRIGSKTPPQVMQKH